MLRRQAAPVDLQVAARLRALRPADAGWVPASMAGDEPPAAGPGPGPGRPLLPPEPADGQPAEGQPAATPTRRGAARPWSSGRVDPGHRGLAALALVALLAAGLAGLLVLRSRPHELAPPALRPPSAAPRTAAPDGALRGAGGETVPPTGEVVVSVAGKVPRPGLLHLAGGSRVDDAVRAAGGALPGADLTGLNLARRLVDGEQVLVGLPQAPAAGPGASAPSEPLDLNAATLAQFDALPGIGPVLAQKIVDWRSEHGRFGSVDQLREVPGIGESKYAELKSKVRT